MNSGDSRTPDLASAPAVAAERAEAAAESAARVAREVVRPDPARAAAYTADLRAEREAAAERAAAQDVRLTEAHRLPNDPIYREARGDQLEAQDLAAQQQDPRDVPLPYGQDHLLDPLQIQYLNLQKGEPTPAVDPTPDSPAEKLVSGKGGLDPTPGSGPP